MAANHEDESNSTDSDGYNESFYSIKMSNKCLDAISKHDEAFTTIQIKGPKLDGTKSLRLKLDIGAQGNVLPICTFKQTYGDTDPEASHGSTRHCKSMWARLQL